MHAALQLRQKGVIRDIVKTRRAACNRRRAKPRWYQRLLANRSAQQWLMRNIQRHGLAKDARPSHLHGSVQLGPDGEELKSHSLTEGIAVGLQVIMA